MFRRHAAAQARQHQVRRRPGLAATRLATSHHGSMPDTPDPRPLVTQRIIAHVTRGWPRLGEPIVHHRGQFCYISCPPSPPGHREPTPIVRLRYQGSADRRAIGIYQASSSQCTESELPASFGPKTGTQNKGSMTPSPSTRAPKLAADGAQPAPGHDQDHKSAKHE